MPTSEILIRIDHRDAVMAAGIRALLAGRDNVRLQDGADGAGAAPPQIIVADYERGVALARRLASLPKQTAPRVLVITLFDKEIQICTALESGVLGYLLQSCSVDELFLAIQRVRHGKRYLCHAVAHCVANRLTHVPLTPREMDVLQLLAQGRCNKIIARELGICVGTVKTHMKGLMQKLNVTARTHAVVVAAQRGMLRPGAS
jgi:DNA-binding NarL/FixJ family response regulator